MTGLFKSLDILRNGEIIRNGYGCYWDVKAEEHCNLTLHKLAMAWFLINMFSNDMVLWLGRSSCLSTQTLSAESRGILKQINKQTQKYTNKHQASSSDVDSGKWKIQYSLRNLFKTNGERERSPHLVVCICSREALYNFFVCVHY